MAPKAFIALLVVVPRRRQVGLGRLLDPLPWIAATMAAAALIQQ